MPLPDFDSKFVIVGILLALVILVRFLAGGRPWDQPVRRKRRFGYKGSLSPLREVERREAESGASQGEGGKVIPMRTVEKQPVSDPEKEFFGEDEGK